MYQMNEKALVQELRSIDMTNLVKSHLKCIILGENDKDVCCEIIIRKL